MKIDTSKPSARPIASGGRRYTVSIALPGSIIANVQRLEWKTNLAGQVHSIDRKLIYIIDWSRVSRLLCGRSGNIQRRHSTN